MAVLWRITQNLQTDGIPPDAEVYDQLAEKSWYYVLRLEYLFSLFPENQFTLGRWGITPEFPIPRSVLDKFTPSKLSELNPNDHYFLQN